MTAALVACGGGDTAGTVPPVSADPTASPTTTGSAPPSSVAAVSASAPPATSAMTSPPEPGDGPLGALPEIEPVEVTEPCPASDRDAVSNETIGSAMNEEGRLNPMLGQVLAYGTARPDQFGAHGLIWHGPGDASVFGSFTGNLDQHRAALAEIVEFPDELIVCQVPISSHVRNQLQAHLLRELDGMFSSLGGGISGAVEIRLIADQEELAASLVDDYGDAVEVSVGALAYPLDGVDAFCWELPPGAEHPGLVFEVVPPTDSLRAVAFDAPTLTARLTNEGPATISIDSGEFGHGVLLDTSGRVVNAFVFDEAAVGMTTVIDPGETAEVPIRTSTASCRADLGYQLPAGDYTLIAQLSDALSSPLTVAVAGG